MNNAITINTRFNIDEIRQEVRSSDDIRRNIHEHIMNLRDQGVREALKKLGWTPPGEESVQNQLCARIEELEQERDALAAHVERLSKAAFDAIHYLPGGKNKAELMDAYDDTPETNLSRLKAQWQAEALESCENNAETSFMPYLGREEQVVLMDDILKVAAELRRQAEGGEV